MAGRRKPTFSKEKRVVLKSLYDAGYTMDQVKEIIGCSKGVVVKAVHEFESDKKLIEWYKQNRSGVLAKVQMDNLALHEAIVGSVGLEQIAAMTNSEKATWARNTAVNAGIMYDKERLENDLSTENVDKRLAIIMKIKEEDRKELNQGGE